MNKSKIRIFVDKVHGNIRNYPHIWFVIEPNITNIELEQMGLWMNIKYF